jgi:hypothetical protein
MFIYLNTDSFFLFSPWLFCFCCFFTGQGAEEGDCASSFGVVESKLVS